MFLAFLSASARVSGTGYISFLICRNFHEAWFPTNPFVTFSLICSSSWKEGVYPIKLMFCILSLSSRWIGAMRAITGRLEREREKPADFSPSFSALGSIPAKGCIFLGSKYFLSSLLWFGLPPYNPSFGVPIKLPFPSILPT